MALWDVALPFPTWAWLIWHGVEFIVGLIFSIRLLRSSHYHRMGFALLFFLLTPLIHASFYLGYLGPTIVHTADRAVLFVVLIIIGTASTREERESSSGSSDDLSL